MEEKSKKSIKALKVFEKVLENLGINDWVLAVAFEEEGQEVQQVAVNGSADKIAHFILTVEERSEDVKNHIIMHRMERLLEAFGKIEEEE